MRKYILGLLCVFFLFLTGAAQPFQAKLHQLSLEDGLPNPSVIRMLQDRQGFLWVATPSGLFRYDGYRFNPISGSDGPISNLFEDSEDHLWIMSPGALVEYHRKKDSLMVRDSIVKRRRVFSMSELEDGTLLFGTEDGILQYTRDGKVEEFMEATQPYRLVMSFQFRDLEGKLYFIQGDELVIYQGRERKETIQLKYANNHRPTAFHLRNGSVLYSTQNGLASINGHKQEMVISFADSLAGYRDPKLVVEDQSGYLWIPQKGKGVGCFAFERGKLVLKGVLLEAYEVSHVLEDREGNLWIATQEDGLFFLSQQARNIQTSFFSNFASSRIYHLQADSGTNHVWLSAHPGITQHFSWEIDTFIQAAIQPPIGRLRAQVRLQDGGDLLADESGLSYWKNGSVQFFLSSNEIGIINSLHQNEEGQIFIASSMWCIRLGLASLAEAADANQVGILNMMGDVFLHNGTGYEFMDLKGQNASLISLPQGIYEVPDTLKTFNEEAFFAREKPISKTVAKRMIATSDGVVWIATNGNGVLVWKNGSYFLLNNTPRTPISNVCNDLAIAGASGVWVATNQGILRLSDPDFKEDTVQLLVYDKRDGLPSNEVTAVAAFQDQVIVGTRKGLASFDISGFQPTHMPPPVFITRVVLPGNPQKNLVNEPQIVLSPNDNQITLYFTCLSYSSLGRVRYRYRLEGSKTPEWIDTYTPFVTYNLLPPGEYQFVVNAISQNGILSQGAETFSFTVKKPFWQRWDFIAISILVVLVLLFFLFRYWDNLRQRALLKRRVEEKTAELSQKIEELSRTNDELEQFAFAASHDLKTPLRTIIGHLQLLEHRYTGKLDEQADEYIDNAVSGAKRMYAMISDLLAYAKLGSKQVRFTPVDLDEEIKGVVSALGSQLDETGGKVTWENLPQVKGAGSQLSLLLQNLISNGLKFNDKPLPTVHVSVKNSPHYHVFSVKDNGIGIDEVHHNKIFSLFQRLHTSEYPGTGIGLALCRKIVESHGGLIWIESHKEKGTTFFFTIPKIS
ncbi:MAG: ATP-binding protein [Bacteroidota bacterium]